MRPVAMSAFWSWAGMPWWIPNTIPRSTAECGGGNAAATVAVNLERSHAGSASIPVASAVTSKLGAVGPRNTWRRPEQQRQREERHRRGDGDRSGRGLRRDQDDRRGERGGP